MGAFFMGFSACSNPNKLQRRNIMGHAVITSGTAATISPPHDQIFC